MTRAEGYSAEYKDYKLYVEVADEGWQVRVYHVPGKKWAYKNDVDSPERGKDDAIATAVAAENPKATADDHAVAKRSVAWTRYGPGSK
jgi:hypothetical protein